MNDRVNHLGNFALRTSFALLLLSFSTFAAAPTALAEDPALLVAQAGSTGGTLGKEEKSASGGERTYAPKKVPKAPSATRRLRGGPPAKPMTASLALFDGTWAGVSTGPCILRWTWSLQASNGVLVGASGANLTGQVNRSGAATGTMVVLGSHYDFVGHMNESEASGTWVDPGPRGCTGTWVATKS
jgi:hypothetical protein